MRPVRLNLAATRHLAVKTSAVRADEIPMSGKPRKSADRLYLLLREGGSEEFNRRTQAGETSDLRGCDFRGVDLRAVDVANIDFSDCYFRQTDLRGLDLRSCLLEGASLHAAHISGAYFPLQLAPEEIEMSVLASVCALTRSVDPAAMEPSILISQLRLCPGST